MNNNKKFILVGGVIALMLAFVWFFAGTAGNGPKDRGFISSNWKHRFKNFDKDPLGLYLYNTLLHEHINKRNDLYEARDWMELDSIMDANTRPKTFMFVGNFFGMKNSEMGKIVADVEEGSDLFISYNEATDNVMPYFFHHYEERYEYNTAVNVFTKKNKCSMINIYQNDTIACDWNAFGEIVTRGPSTSLSSFMEMDNFIVMEMGKGRVFLQTNPGMYYNYQIKRSSGFKYAEYTIDQFSKDKDVVILELGRMSDGYGNHGSGDDDGPGGKKDDSYLKILFENPTLLTALLLSILGMILFVSFRSKRKRPVVAYHERKQDMTLAFAETITSIYFSKRNPYGLLQVQRKNFYSTIHKHFFVDLSKRNEEDRELTILAEKSNKPLSEIKEIVKDLETKEVSQVTEAQVADMAKRQREFYREVGIIPEAIQERVEERELKFNRSLLLPVLMILAGITAIIIGLYFLVTSRGVGIALWPVGIALLFLGVARIANPYMRVDTKTLVYYTSLGKKKVFLRSELIGIEMKESGVVLKFTHDRRLIINYWDLSRFDKMQLSRFITKLHTLEL